MSTSKIENYVPRHVLYGGAHLFSVETPNKLSRLVQAGADKLFPDHQSFASHLDVLFPSLDWKRAFQRFQRKLRERPIEDIRIDFEDGLGRASPAEEDGLAQTCASALAELWKSGSNGNVRIGIRIKSPSPETYQRSKRTLQLFLQRLKRDEVPFDQHKLIVCLPKLTSRKDVKGIADQARQMCKRLRIPSGFLRYELLVEDVIALRDPSLWGYWQAFLKEKLIGVHLGIYDLLSSAGVGAPFQSFTHPLADRARLDLLTHIDKQKFELYDGVSTVLPKEGAQESVSQLARHFLHSFKLGFSSGWDIHPTQTAVRWAVTAALTEEWMEPLTKRYLNYLEQREKPAATGVAFDDEATIRGLRLFFTSCLGSGFALPEDEFCKFKMI